MVELENVVVRMVELENVVVRMVELTQQSVDVWRSIPATKKENISVLRHHLISTCKNYLNNVYLVALSVYHLWLFPPAIFPVYLLTQHYVDVIFRKVHLSNK